MLPVFEPGDGWVVRLYVCILWASAALYACLFGWLVCALVRWLF